MPFISRRRVALCKETQSGGASFLSVEPFQATAATIEIRDLKEPDSADVRPPSPPES